MGYEAGGDATDATSADALIILGSIQPPGLRDIKVWYFVYFSLLLKELCLCVSI